MMLPIINLYTCRETLARLNDFVDRELSETEQRRVERHLKICRECRHKFAFETDLMALMRERIARLDAPPALWERVSAAVSGAEE